jgi:hypothetical protein
MGSYQPAGCDESNSDSLRPWPRGTAGMWVAVFTDAGINGTKGRDKRPGYDGLCYGVARSYNVRQATISRLTA